MQIARYWAFGATSAISPRGETIHRALWRGSDVSEADAKDEVDCALRDLEWKVRSGEPVKDWYSYAELTWPEPLVEDIVGADGSRVAAVTLNRHGVTVLNTARIPFIDVDLDASRRAAPRRGLLARLFARPAPAPPRDPFGAAIEKLDAWVRESPAHSARVYRTAAGLRYMLPATELDPACAEAAALLARLHADPLYATLCRAQRCYRARLSPKPWRIGAGSPPVRFKYGRDMSGLDRWSREYEHAAAGYAVCELVTVLGEAAPTLDAVRVLELHDAATRVGAGLPLA